MFTSQDTTVVGEGHVFLVPAVAPVNRQLTVRH